MSDDRPVVGGITFGPAETPLERHARLQGRPEVNPLDLVRTTSCGHTWTLRHTACPTCFGELQTELASARATNSTLHRRAQAAESQVCSLTNEVEAWGEELAQITAELEAQAGRATCAACGFLGTDQEVRAHLLVCEEHPLRKLLAAAQERILMLETVAVWTKEPAPLPPLVPQAEEGDAPAPSPTTTEGTTP